MKRLALSIPLILFAGFAAALGFGLNRDPSRIPSVIIDRPMPGLKLAALTDGGNGFATEDLEGKVSLVNVFGSWCGICAEEHPMLMRLARENAVALYGVDWKDTRSEGQAWLDKNGNPFTRTGSDESGRAAIDLGVTGAPESFIVDKTGRIRYKQIGAITADVWQKTLAPLVAKLEAEP